MHETLIGEWRRGVAARGALLAALLTIPIAVAALIGLGGGANLPFGLSALAAGPSERAAGAGPSQPGGSAARALGGLAGAVAATPTAAAGGAAVTGGGGASGGAGGSAGGGGSTGPGGSGGSGPPSGGSTGGGGGGDGGGGGGVGTGSVPSVGDTISPVTQPLPQPAGNTLQQTAKGLDDTIGGLTGH
jgi:hypothetical protein